MTIRTENEYYHSGKLYCMRWYENNIHHRSDGPAAIYYNHNGDISSRVWVNNDCIHKDNGPAIIRYDKRGNIDTEQWCLEGQHHRIDGPAIINYYLSGKTQYTYYLDDETCSFRIWCHRTNNDELFMKMMYI